MDAQQHAQMPMSICPSFWRFEIISESNSACWGSLPAPTTACQPVMATPLSEQTFSCGWANRWQIPNVVYARHQHELADPSPSSSSRRKRVGGALLL